MASDGVGLRLSASDPSRPSRVNISCEQAQLRMDDARLVDPLTESLRTLNRLAKALKAKRAASGALSLASPEVRFALDSETRGPRHASAHYGAPSRLPTGALRARLGDPRPHRCGDVQSQGGQLDGRRVYAPRQHHSCEADSAGLPPARDPAPPPAAAPRRLRRPQPRAARARLRT